MSNICSRSGPVWESGMACSAFQKYSFTVIACNSVKGRQYLKWRHQGFSKTNKLIFSVSEWVNCHWHFLSHVLHPGCSRIWRGKSSNAMQHFTSMINLCIWLQLLCIFLSLSVSTGPSLFVWKRREGPSRKSGEFCIKTAFFTKIIRYLFCISSSQTYKGSSRLLGYNQDLTFTNSRVEKGTQASEGNLV